MTVLTTILLMAVSWYPSAEWADVPDPVASPRARQGGIVRFNGGQPPKSFNYYIDCNTYTHMMFALMYDSLIGTDSQTLDFVPALARRWAVSDDGKEFTFVLDARAKWSDGRPITAEDVKWTFEQLMNPRNDTGVFRAILGGFETPVILDARTVRFTLKPGTAKDWRDLNKCGSFFILPKHAFEGKDFNKLDLLNAPVSGPYRLAFVQERVRTEYARVKNWWRQEFPSSKNLYNFDRIVMRYYMSNENAFEALKKDLIDVYPVYSARIMAYETLGEKFQKNWLLKRRIKNHLPVGYQGFAMNLRRWPFDDVRVRRAMAKLIDRELMNRTLMSNEYFLLRSFYTDLYDAQHPCTNVFHRYDFEAAEKLLKEAGFAKDNEGRLCQNGRPFTFTFLSRSAGEDKFLALFRQNLVRLGIDMKIDRSDFANWMKQIDAFNFDMTWAAMSGSLFKAPEVSWLGSEADRPQSANFTGFKSARVDELIVAEKSMTRMADRQAIYREIDAILTDACPYAFLWNIAETRLLYWNRFGTPETILGKYGDEESVLTYWWYDEDRATELKDAISKNTFLPAVPLRVDYDKTFPRKEKTRHPIDK